MPLTSDAAGAGGRLVFLGRDGSVALPQRSAGVPLTHDGVTVHGVTRLDAPALRYGLFACRGEEEEEAGEQEGAAGGVALLLLRSSLTLPA